MTSEGCGLWGQDFMISYSFHAFLDHCWFAFVETIIYVTYTHNTIFNPSSAGDFASLAEELDIGSECWTAGDLVYIGVES